MTSRRDFIGALGATGAFAAVGLKGGAEEVDPGRVRMRFGVLSDIHISTHRQLPYFEKTLRKLDEWKVDAVLACGDLADYALRPQLKLVADTWFKVFPNGNGSDGRPVANLMHYGDHDMQDDRYVDYEDAVKEWPDKAFRHAEVIRTLGAKKVWEECFHEEWAPIVLKEVKGYSFVLSHFTKGEPGNPYGNNVPGLKEFLAAHAFDPAKPFFYSQHRIPKNTACGPLVDGQEDGTTTRIFADYPNLIAFCGHCHMNGAYEKSIWQGAFTCVQVPSLRYCATQAGRENGYCGQDRPPEVPVQPSKMMGALPSGRTSQGFLCTVCERAVVIRRWDFHYDLPLGPDWVIPISSFALPTERRPFAFANRAKAVPAPAFPSGAEVKLSWTRGRDRAKTEHEMVSVSFPPATAVAPRADDYEVTVEMKEREVERVFLQKRVYSSRYLFAEKMDDQPVVCLFARDELPDGWPVRFTVRPLNAFGAKGEPIQTGFAPLSAIRRPKGDVLSGNAHIGEAASRRLGQAGEAASRRLGKEC